MAKHRHQRDEPLRVRLCLRKQKRRCISKGGLSAASFLLR
nr:MAG TPA: hypothetical protein [Caudoviricetes sp.]